MTKEYTTKEFKQLLLHFIAELPQDGVEFEFVLQNTDFVEDKNRNELIDLDNMLHISHYTAELCGKLLSITRQITITEKE